MNISKKLTPHFKVTKVQGRTVGVTESMQRSCWKTIDLAHWGYDMDEEFKFPYHQVPAHLLTVYMTL